MSEHPMSIRNLISALQEHPSGWPAVVEVEGQRYWITDARSLDGPSIVLSLGGLAVVPPTPPFQGSREG